jgi:molecular chaperone DnaK (HSP70)
VLRDKKVVGVSLAADFQADINEVVLVGGSTHIPAIQNLVESLGKSQINL